MVVPSLQMQSQLIDGCRRLARKGFLNSPEDSFSVRIPGSGDFLLATGLEDWSEVGASDIRTMPFHSADEVIGIHAATYEARGDAGAVVILSPLGARLLARHDGLLPRLFDEQARHLGRSVNSLPDKERVHRNMLKKALKRGTNALLLGKQLLCLGMTCERVLFNAELHEKCAQAYVIAKESGADVGCIPALVGYIANRRLLKNERDAAASYREGRLPEGISGY